MIEVRKIGDKGSRDRKDHERAVERFLLHASRPLIAFGPGSKVNADELQTIRHDLEVLVGKTIRVEIFNDLPTDAAYFIDLDINYPDTNEFKRKHGLT